MHELLNLPVILLVGVFTEWLDMAALVALDSASCSVASRKAYLDILISNEACFHQAPDPPTLHSKAIQWFVTRKAKVGKVVMEGLHEFDYGKIKSFLHISGSSLQCLRITDCTTTLSAILTLLSSSSPRLRTLIIESCRDPDSAKLGALLSACSHTLKRLQLESCETVLPLPASPLPSLEMLHISATSMDPETLCRLIASSPGLRSYLTNNPDDTDACFDALATHCPLLQVLSYENGRPSLATLERIVQCCPAIAVVDISCFEDAESPTILDEHIVTIMQHCRQLKVFRAGFLDDETSLTLLHNTLLAVAARVKDLRHLYLYSLGDDTVTADWLTAIAPDCGTLTSLELHSIGDLHYDALIALVSNLHSVEELLIHSEQDDHVLCAVATYCPQLRWLNLCACSDYTYKGLVAVALGCTRLEKLFYEEGDVEVLNPFGETLWKALQPGLELIDGDNAEVGSVITTLLDIERDEVEVW